MINELINEEAFPLIECIYVTSSNVNGDTVSAYAVTKVVETNEGNRLNFLMKLIKNKELSAPEIIKGFSYAQTKHWSVPDKIIKKHKIFSEKDEFEVMWLQNSYLSSEYHGNAGYEIRKFKGIVLHYPRELKSIA